MNVSVEEIFKTLGDKTPAEYFDSKNIDKHKAADVVRYGMVLLGAVLDALKEDGVMVPEISEKDRYLSAMLTLIATTSDNDFKHLNLSLKNEEH